METKEMYERVTLVLNSLPVENCTIFTGTKEQQDDFLRLGAILFKFVEGSDKKMIVSTVGDIYKLQKDGTYEKARPCLNRSGYPQIHVPNVGTKTVHRLVAETFLGIPEEKREVDHIDRNKTNNTVDNLRWVTHSENSRNVDPSCYKNRKYLVWKSISCYNPATGETNTYPDPTSALKGMFGDNIPAGSRESIIRCVKEGKKAYGCTWVGDFE